MGRGLKIQDLAFLGRVGNSVNPNAYPGLHRWYKADSFSGTDGQRVGGGVNPLGVWVDQTGSGDNGSQAAVAGPMFKTNIVGTMPVIRAGGEWLSFAPGALTTFTIIAACRESDVTSCFLMAGSVNLHQIRLSFNDNQRLFYNGTGGGQAASAWGAPLDFGIITIRRTGSAVSFRENKTARGGGVYDAGAFTVNQIISQFNVGLDLGELLIYTTELSDANVDALYDGYLKPRWSLP